MAYFETSAKSAENVKEAFEDISKKSIELQKGKLYKIIYLIC